MNIPNPHTNPTPAPAASSSSSLWDYLAPLAGGVVGGFITHNLFGGDSIITTLIGAGVGALFGGIVKGWIAPKDPQPQVQPTSGVTPPQLGKGPQPGLESLSPDQLAKINAERAKQTQKGFDAHNHPAPPPAPAGQPRAR